MVCLSRRVRRPQLSALAGGLALFAALLAGCDDQMVSRRAEYGVGTATMSGSVNSAGAGSCPVEPSACVYAEQLERWLVTQDLDAVVSQLQAQVYVCDGPEPQGLGGPYPLCEGSRVGEERSGYPLGYYQSEGVVLSPEQYKGNLGTWLRNADGSRTDELGSGAPRLVSLGCATVQATTSPPCPSGFAAVFSAITAEGSRPVRTVFVFIINRSGDKGMPRITATVQGLPEASVFQAMRQGGDASGGTYFPWRR